MRPSFQDHGETFYNKSSDQAEYTGYSESSKRMMKNMGFKPGRGLGKFEHGRTQPVEASTQKGRRGLGAKPSVVGELPQDFKPSTEEVKPEAKEEVVSLNTANYTFILEPRCSGSFDLGSEGIGLQLGLKNYGYILLLRACFVKRYNILRNLQSWLNPAPEEPPPGDVLEKWLKRGPKKLTIEDETDFVDPAILKGVLDAKVCLYLNLVE